MAVFSKVMLVVTALLLQATTTDAMGKKWERMDGPINDGNVGPRDRFWRHHAAQKTLIYEGVDRYEEVQSCLNELLSEEDWEAIKTQTAKGIRAVGRMYKEQDDDENEGQVFLVHIKKAMLPIHVKAVQTMAACARKVMPHLYESRAMYQEQDYDEDPGLGGNCPTHLVPLLSIFFPKVLEQMQENLEFAYEAAGWVQQVQWGRLQVFRGEAHRDQILHPPHVVGIRASEHLTYNDFPMLADHVDGESTIYTMNYAFSEDYEGGEFYIVSDNEEKHFIKPQKYDCLIFLGGTYIHGVNEIKGGFREMFSTEFWPYPDAPFGSSLWNNNPENMSEYILACNREMVEKGTDFNTPCTAKYSKQTTAARIDLDELRNKYSGSDTPKNPMTEKRPNRVRPKPLQINSYKDENGRVYNIEDFRPVSQEPDFLVPNKLETGEMVPIRWRHNLMPVDGNEGESFVIGFPPELHQEFLAYVAKSGMMNVARKILYEEEELQPDEHRIYTLEDGQKWGAMIQGSWNTDMVWLDPADEECFESLMSLLRRGNFDEVLKKVGSSFDLEGLMIQGVGAIFLTEYEYSENMHIDIPGSKGSFYNIIVPVHIPENDVAEFYVADAHDVEEKGTVKLDPNVGLVLGGESYHGTGECNYRDEKDFRLSFAIYVADINDSNIDLIASDSTSLWPTSGDTEWFVAQRGRFWSKDGTRSLKEDKGRASMNVKDLVDNCTVEECESDPTGKRLECPKTCRLYLNDEDYYPLLQTETVKSDEQKPSKTAEKS